MSYEMRQVVLTGATDSETVNNVNGRLVKIEIENSATDQPTDNWDLIVYTGTSGSNDYEVLFTDTTISNGNTAKIVYLPVVPASIASTGAASTLTEVPPIVFNKAITISGANMGATKVATVRLIFEQR